MRGPLDRLNDRLGIWDTRAEKHQVLAVLAIFFCWLAVVVVPVFMLSPETFWQKIVMGLFTIVWAAVTGVVFFLLAAATVKILEDDSGS